MSNPNEHGNIALGYVVFLVPFVSDESEQDILFSILCNSGRKIRVSNLIHVEGTSYPYNDSFCELLRIFADLKHNKDFYFIFESVDTDSVDKCLIQMTVIVSENSLSNQHHEFSTVLGMILKIVIGAYYLY